MDLDFALNNKGDIIFTKDTKEVDSLNVSFNITHEKPLVVKFHILDSSPLYIPKSALKITFNIDQSIQDTFEALTITGQKLLKQQIEIRLRTALGELKSRPEIGSELEKYRHVVIDDNSLSEIKKSALNALRDLLINPFVEINKDADIYTRNLVLNVYEDNTFITKFRMEV